MGGVSAFRPPGDCPNCGEEVPAGAMACPHCGADARTGWSEETYLDGVDLPGEAESAGSRADDDGLARGLTSWLALGLAVLLALVLSGAWWLLR